jgi:hypothetical protein
VKSLSPIEAVQLPKQTHSELQLGNALLPETELRKLDVTTLSPIEAVQLPKQAHSQVQLGNEGKSNLGDHVSYN